MKEHFVACYFYNQIGNCQVEAKHYYLSKSNTFLFGLCEGCNPARYSLFGDIKGNINPSFDLQFKNINLQQYLNYQILK